MTHKQILLKSQIISKDKSKAKNSDSRANILVEPDSQFIKFKKVEPDSRASILVEPDSQFIKFKEVEPEIGRASCRERV